MNLVINHKSNDHKKHNIIKVLIQKACDSLYFQLFLELKDLDSVAFEHHLAQ